MDRVFQIDEFIQSLKSSERMGQQVAYHRIMPPVPAALRDFDATWPAAIRKLLRDCGIHRLYRHQKKAVNLLRSDRHVVVATPTASGKTLIYNLPVIENHLKDPGSRALYLFPLKALAQDQLRAFRRMAGFCPGGPPAAEIYDGDTTAWKRRKIREIPPQILLTNPEMLHLAILSHHRKWSEFLSRLRMVVVDEVHTYRGVLGSHMAQVLRRLSRICDHYGSSPNYLFSSATIGNPSRLTEQLSGRTVKAVTESGAPRGRRHVLLIDPDRSPVQSTILLLKAALHRKLRTIVYTQSRRLSELIVLWAGTKSGTFRQRICAYRAGLLPEERRNIEARLASGDLLAVVSTSALELGIDIGDLDLCLLVGYPGTFVSMLQRWGRVGRSGQDSALVLIAGEDALDQYFIRNPNQLFERRPEAAVTNPYNPEIMSKHIVCAAAELPLKRNERYLSDPPLGDAVLRLEMEGKLLRSADGNVVYSRRRMPHRHVDLRGGGNRYAILCRETGKQRGEVDDYRVFRETHPGAVYLHQGKTYVVDSLDMDARTVRVTEIPVDYYTKVRSVTDVEILDVHKKEPAYGTWCFTGRVRVTDRIRAYEKWRIHGRKMLVRIPLNLPPLIFESEGIWFEIPGGIKRTSERIGLDFVGGIHAVEHAAIGIFPLLVMADRNDLGGVSTPYHPQVGGAAVFIYDGIPGGAGLTRQVFGDMNALFDRTYEIMEACPCDSGCPLCVHSPKCGSGNRPLDKIAGMRLLAAIRSAPVPSDTGGVSVNSTRRKEIQPQFERVAVFDLETQRSAEEVGGWHRADRMGISCAVLHDMKTGRFFEYLEPQVLRLIDDLKTFDRVVGFNIKRFDYRVLNGYSRFDFLSLPTLDVLEEIQRCLGFRLSLDHLARMTLSKEKYADGLQALEWWRQGKIREILDYCRMDVEITRDLYLFGLKNGYLLFRGKEDVLRIPVQW